MTRRSQQWQTRPGSMDALNLSQLFPSDNPLGIPRLSHTPLACTPAWLAPFRARIRSQRALDNGAVHFFLSDYRFEAVWNRPRQALAALVPFRILLTPDFSLYRDWPRAAQIWNVYRSRWCGAFWQSQGFTVIPTISWSTAVSFDFCFLGVPARSLVAVSTVGLRLGQNALNEQLFLAGFREMVRRLQPGRVLCYGRPPAPCYDLADVVAYPTRWEGIRQARLYGRYHGRPRHPGEARGR